MSIDIIVMIVTALGFGFYLNTRRKNAEAELKIVDLKNKDKILSIEQSDIEKAISDLDKGLESLKEQRQKRLEDEKQNVLSMEERKNAWKDRK